MLSAPPKSTLGISADGCPVKARPSPPSPRWAATNFASLAPICLAAWAAWAAWAAIAAQWSRNDKGLTEAKPLL